MSEEENNTIILSADKASDKGTKRDAKERSRRRGLVGSIILGSVIVHAIGLVIFGIFSVFEYFREEPPVFEVTEVLKIPPQTPQHRMNMAEHEAMAPKPSFTDKLISTRPMEFALPDLPKVPIDQMLPLDPSDLISDQVNSLVGSAGLGSGIGDGLTGGGGTGGGSGFSFFGIEDTATSVVIMIDVSASMFGRTGDLDYSTGKMVREGKDQSFQQVRDEAIKLIEALGPSTRFGIIRWSGSARSWQPALVPASDENKAAAKAHVQDVVDANSSGPQGGRPGGTRHDYALELLFQLKPESAFLLSDGNATRSKQGGGSENIPAKELTGMIDARKAETGSVPRIHTLYYLTGKDVRDEEKMLRGISRKTRGKFDKIKVKKRKGDR